MVVPIRRPALVAIMISITDYIEARSLPAAGGCRLWTRAVNGAGYPVGTLGGKQVNPARILLEHIAGPAPSGCTLWQTCGDRKCLAPEHLVWRPAAEAHRYRGSVQRKLREDQVHTIRRRLASGDETHREIAADYRISRDLISKIRCGKLYGDIPGDPLPSRQLRLRDMADQELAEWILEQAETLPDGCRISSLSVQPSGYTRVSRRGRTVQCHRLVCSVYHGPPPPDHVCSQTCGRKDCVNPAHLRWITRRRVAKERWKRIKAG